MQNEVHGTFRMLLKTCKCRSSAESFVNVDCGLPLCGGSWRRHCLCRARDSARGACPCRVDGSDALGSLSGAGVAGVA